MSDRLLLDTGLFLAKLAAAFLGALLVRFLWRRVLEAVARRTRTSLDEELVRATRSPVFWLVLLAGTKLAVLSYLGDLGDQFSALFPEGGLAARDIAGRAFNILMVAVSARLAAVALSVVTTWYVESAAEGDETSRRLRRELVPPLSKAGALVIYFIAGTMVVDILGQNIGALLATAGVASLAVAFGAQETLANLISGFAIMVDRSFREGDRIELADGIMGDVLQIGLRTTRILSFDNTLIVVPNRDMAGARIINHSYPDDRLKIRPKVGVSYGSDIDRAKEVMYEVCSAHPKVLADPPPAVYFTDFGDSSLNLMAICWIEDYHERFSTLDEINTEIKKRFDREGIEIPFPQRDIHLRDGVLSLKEPSTMLKAPQKSDSNADH